MSSLLRWGITALFPSAAPFAGVLAVILQIVSVGSLVTGAYLYIRHQGVAAERARWELAEAKATIQLQRERERAAGQVIAQAQAEAQRAEAELTTLQAERDRYVADLKAVAQDSRCRLDPAARERLRRIR